MDIFTTQLTRVVPVPIKPANLKVKALLKEAGTGKLKEDPDHLENHDYYFARPNSDKDEEQQETTEQGAEHSDKEFSKESQANLHESDLKAKEHKHSTNDSGITESEDGVKHLDLYI